VQFVAERAHEDVADAPGAGRGDGLDGADGIILREGRHRRAAEDKGRRN
jgi:hypothetical protein